MNRRPLKKIAAEIATALKREVTDVLEVGCLLSEAKEQLDEHGRWLPWLKDNFPLSVRTAQKYMAAAAFASKYELDAHLRLSVSGLYALVDVDRNGEHEAVAAALVEAKTKWVDDARVTEIVAALRAPPEGGDEGPPPDGASGDEGPPASSSDDPGGEDDEEGDAGGDDRPPPTPSSSLTPKQAAQLEKFDAAVKGLLPLRAKPAREFLTTGISPLDLEELAGLLQQIATEKRKPSPADGAAQTIGAGRKTA